MTISSLHLRIFSGLVLGPLFILAIYFGGLVFQGVVAICFGLSVKEWVNMARQGGSIIRVVRDCILGLIYLTFCFVAFLKLRMDIDEGMILTVILFIGVVSSDVFAFIFGKILKGPKLIPAISPNKTWSGLLGSAVGGLIIIVGFNYFIPFLPMQKAVFTGLAFGIIGQIGDLIVSMYKRRAGVKDTGNLIPGHGGILDRIDSLALVTPFFLIIVLEFGL